MKNRQPYGPTEPRPDKVCELEGLRAVSGGIAHDCIGLMTAITGNLNQALHHIGPGSPIDPMLRNARCAAATARDLAEKLAAFSNGKPGPGQPVRILPLIEKTIDYCLCDCPGIECRYAIKSPGCAVAIDPGFFSQALYHVIENAISAMPGGGCLAVSLHRSHPPLPAAAETCYTALIIQDQGMGISPEHLDDVFIPYFSAWPGSSGNRKTGLGLSIARAIVRHYNGDITVDSRPGNGTTVCMYLPS